MERIEKEVEDSNYKANQHFISNIKWKYHELIRKLALDALVVLNHRSLFA